jgi:hypothetical protein
MLRWLLNWMLITDLHILLDISCRLELVCWYEDSQLHDILPIQVKCLMRIVDYKSTEMTKSDR